MWNIRITRFTVTGLHQTKQKNVATKFFLTILRGKGIWQL